MKISELRKISLHDKRWIVALMEIRMIAINGMREHGITGADLSKRTGLSLAVITRITKAEHNLTLSDIAKIETAFGELRREQTVMLKLKDNSDKGDN